MIETKLLRRTAFKLLLLCILLLAYFFSESAFAQGNLLVFPKRIVFEDGKKSETINLSNVGRDTAKYNISFVQIRMNENGTFENILTPDSGQLFADTFLRFYPRAVTLAPNESQVIKIQLTKTDRLKPGEYRSHLYFRAVPRNNEAPENAPSLTDTSTIAVHLVPIFGITIATIIRIGEPNTQVSLSNLNLDLNNPSAPVLHVDLNRSGNMSVYGNIEVRYISPSGKETKISEIQGVAVYTPGSKRKFKMELQSPRGVDFSSGRLKVIYSAQADHNNVTLAQDELIL